jgi:nodulation protein E
MRRVAVTGIGILSSLGRGPERHLEAVLGGESGIRAISLFDSSPLQCRIGGELPPGTAPELERGLDRFAGLGLLAARDAAASASFEQGTVPPERLATVIGSGLGGSETIDAAYQRLYREENPRLHPMSIPRIMYNAATSAVSAAFGARGPSLAPVSACSSAAHAIGLASQWIRWGVADAAFAGGADAPLTYGILRGWEALRVLAIDNEHPERACRPFSADRKGLVLAEGAAVFFLEEMDRAVRRGVPILGEIAGSGMNSDAGHLTDPSPQGQGAAMRLALEDGGVEPATVGYINAHGTGTRANDATETRAIRALFGPHAERLAVSSTKSMHGHAMGASGAIETALSLIALNAGWIPPTLNRDQPDPECDLDVVPLAARRGEVELFLSNSFGFGGLNAVLAVRTARGA